MNYRELLLGCGRSREKRICAPSNPTLEWRGLVTTDYNRACNPDFVIDLELVPWRYGPENQYFFDNESFDEIHAYEILEHLGHQGHVLTFFRHFAEIWRLLKPGGYLVASCPSRFSPWAWGDPGHTRIISRESLEFLRRPSYKQCDATPPSPMSDYRSVWRGDFEIIESIDDRKSHVFILQAIKPIRE